MAQTRGYIWTKTGPNVLQHSNVPLLKHASSSHLIPSNPVPSFFRDSLVKGLVHSLVSQLDAQESSSVSRHSSSQRRRKAREESLVTASPIKLLNDATNRHVAFGSLQPALDGIDGEHRDPHGHTSARTSNRDGAQAKLAAGLAGYGVLGRQRLLDVLVRGEVGGGTWAVARQCGDGAAEDGAHAAFLVQLAHDVHAARVLGLFAGRELLLALDLQDHLDALKGGGDGGHGDGGEEAGGGDLGDGEVAVGGDGGGGAHDLLAKVVAPEGDGNCLWERVSTHSFWEKKRERGRLRGGGKVGKT